MLVHGLRGNIVNSATIFVFTRINHLEITGFIMICTQPHMMNGKIENNAYSAALLCCFYEKCILWSFAGVSTEKLKISAFGGYRRVSQVLN